MSKRLTIAPRTIGQMTIGKKLLYGFGTILALTLGVSFVALNGIGNLGAMNEELVKITAKKRLLANQIDRESCSVLAAERGILVRAYMHDRATMAQYNQDFQESADLLKKHLDAVRGLNPAAEDRRLIEEIAVALENIRQGHREFWSEANSNRIVAASTTYKLKTNPAIKQAIKVARALSELQNQAMLQAGLQSEQVATRARSMVLFMIALSLLVSIAAVFVVRQINAALRQTVGELTQGGDQVSSEASHIAASSQTLSQGASEQAASLEEVSASMEQMAAMTKRNAENSGQARAMMSETAAQVERSNIALQAMVASMSAIKSSSEKVAKINKTIDGIAFQTNILALNAAVEAARAGSAGMGFAVVAGEVRSLAQRSALAAKETAGLIEEAISNSNEGAGKLENVSAAIRAITEGAAKVKNLVDEVYEASQQQSQGIDQVATAITQINTVTQNNAASAEESAASSGQLGAQASRMRQLMSELDQMIDGGKSASALPRSSQSSSPQSSSPQSASPQSGPAKTTATRSFSLPAPAAARPAVRPSTTGAPAARPLAAVKASASAHKTAVLESKLLDTKEPDAEDLFPLESSEDGGFHSF